MANIKINLHLFLLAALTFVTAALQSCNGHPSANKPIIDTERFRNGDLIFREGPSLNSEFVKAMSDNRFSHVGMLFKSKGRWMVVHAVPDESEEHETDFVKCEPVESFLDPSKARSSKCMRVRCDSYKALAAVKYAVVKADSHILFDNDYDLNDTSRLYCTELVWQAYRHQGINLVPRFTNVPMFGLGKTKDVIFPVNILKSSYNEKEWTCVVR